MEKPRVLSGDALVAKGITKIDASLPEVGLKDVTPNGSWLEQKQIQSALEARKYLIEMERIEKCGTLSHAEWHDDLMLAEVTQKSGGYWQYLGHNVGKTLYLRPEEALFLMEVNCLLLRHNEVTVSLQKAYSLLLSSSTTLIQYKVYASLSRLGYKVFRHAGPKVTEENKTSSRKDNKLENVSMDVESKYVNSPKDHTIKSDCVDSSIVSTVNKTENFVPSIVSTKNEAEIVDPAIVLTLSNNENGDSPIETVVNECENAVASSVVNTAIDPEKAESESDATIKAVTDTLEDDTLEKSKKTVLPIELHVDKLSEHKLEQEINCSEKTGDIVEMSNVKDGGEFVNQSQAENNVAKENESPNIMEIDESTELKAADDKIENDTIQEVSSTMIEIHKNVENKINCMEICTENIEVVSDIALIEESDDRSKYIEDNPTGEPNSMIKPNNNEVINVLVEVFETNEDAVSATNCEVQRKDTGTQTIDGSTKVLEDLSKNNNPSTSNMCMSKDNNTQNLYFGKDNDSYNFLTKIEKLMKRQLKSSDSKTLERYFENIPDFLRERVVTVNVPEQQFTPKNIFVNKSTYLLNLQNIKIRSVRSASSESPAYTSSDEVNGTNIRRIRSSSELLGSEFPQNPNFFPHGRFPRYHQFRPYGFWRPQNNINFYQLMFLTRLQFHQRPHPSIRPPCISANPNNLNICINARKRMRNGKMFHLQGIKNLAVRLKQSLISGSTDLQNLEILHGLLHSYNLRYKSRLRLTDDFDVVNEEKIVETIELDDDEESKSKKPRLDKDNDDKFDENLYRLKQLALKLRDLETKDKATASHRRAFSKAIKTFNKSYNADIYLDDINYEVIDRRCITLDSSSESDCVVEDQPKVRSKKLRNPFNILKRRKERLQSLNKPSTSKDDDSVDPIKTDPGPTEAHEDNNKYCEAIVKTFNEKWLPNEKDFGRAEIVPKCLMNSRLEFSNKEQFLYEYMKDNQQYQNWLEAKISFLRYLEETNIAFKSEKARILADVELCNTGLKPLIDFEDSSDMPSVLEKLRIIENNKVIDTETSLRIDFDVYNRNVQNFRKRNPPKPHFRIICIDDSSEVPSAAHVMSLHSKYEDNVPIVFAIVGTGSISYLQINPIDLPIYVPSKDVV